MLFFLVRVVSKTPVLFVFDNGDSFLSLFARGSRGIIVVSSFSTRGEILLEIFLVRC